MKIKYLSKILFTVCACLGIISCNNDIGNENSIYNPDNGVIVSLDMKTKSLEVDMGCTMYIFTKGQGDTDYTFEKSVSIDPADGTQVKFQESDLRNESYRFLFLATPSLSPELKVLKQDENSLTEGDSWNTVMIRSIEKQLSENNYYQVLDKVGNDILIQGTIKGELKRMVGQMCMDIYKVDDSKKPVDINQNVALSVIDRVYKVDMECSGMTKDVIFNASNDLIEHSKWGESHTQSFLIESDDNFGVAVPQKYVDPATATTLGSVRVKGICCLPSSEKIRVASTFYYYDTTPTCGVNHSGKTTHNCFQEKELTLHLPKSGDNTNLLKVLANHYTVSKAKIRFDRIIDLDFNSSFDFDYEWDNE